MEHHSVCAGGTPVTAPRPTTSTQVPVAASDDDVAELVASALTTKRDGRTMSAEQASAFVAATASGKVSDAQAGAMCMAVFNHGMAPDELSSWTTAMARSGQVLQWDRPTVDKHSTGGVGDMSSLVVAPLLAAAGHLVPMLSGRSLGHTGGTLDKLESATGFRAELDVDELRRVVGTAGCAIAAASPSLAPADRVLYRVRDETSTVASVPLIASSIVSKKLASGASGLVLDVKCGSAAFLPARAQALELARTMVGLCADAGVPAVAAVTRMDVMCGDAAGNAAEVLQALEVLSGGGDPSLRRLCVDLACAAARLVDPAETHGRLAGLLDSGHAMERFEAMMVAQGARWPLELPMPLVHATVVAPRSGVVWFDALGLARASAALGACRQSPGAAVDPTAGLWRTPPEGTPVSAGDELLVLGCASPTRLERAVAVAEASLRWADEGTAEFDGHQTVLEWVTQEDR